MGWRGTGLRHWLGMEAYLLHIVARQPLKGVVNEGGVHQGDENLGSLQCDWPEALRNKSPLHVALHMQHFSCMHQQGSLFSQRVLITTLAQSHVCEAVCKYNSGQNLAGLNVSLGRHRMVRAWKPRSALLPCSPGFNSCDRYLLAWNDRPSKSSGSKREPSRAHILHASQKELPEQQPLQPATTPRARTASRDLCISLCWRDILNSCLCGCTLVPVARAPALLLCFKSSLHFKVRPKIRLF